MAATPTEAIVNHIHAIMSDSEWNFHGGWIQKIVAANVERAIKEDRAAHKFAVPSTPVPITVPAKPSQKPRPKTRRTKGKS